MINTTELSTAVDTFVKKAQARIDVHFKEHYSNCVVPVLSLEPGSKFIRVVKSDNCGRSVYCFIEKATGNVLKAAGWKAPAKGARGNIFKEDNGMGGVSVWGGNYLR